MSPCAGMSFKRVLENETESSGVADVKCRDYIGFIGFYGTNGTTPQHVQPSVRTDDPTALKSLSSYSIGVYIVNN